MAAGKDGTHTEIWQFAWELTLWLSHLDFLIIN